MKTVYLTIDDGPSKDRKEKVDILYQYGIQPIWFCIGSEIEKRPEDVIYSIRKGGIIGIILTLIRVFLKYRWKNVLKKLRKLIELLTAFIEKLALLAY